MSSDAIHQRVASQFSPTAASYSTSAVHANAAELEQLVSLIKPKPTDQAIDVATGAGHMALALAPFVAGVIAFDLTPSMLEQTLISAKERGLGNVTAMQGAAEVLPYEDASLDIYTVRLAPHHFADIQASINEASRVLRPGGRYLVVDTIAPEDDTRDAQVNEIELLRDPSHVRNYRISEWLRMLQTAGLTIAARIEGRCGTLEFEDWTRRQNVPLDRKATLRHKFETASEELTTLLTITKQSDTFAFTLPQVTILAIRP